MVLLESAVALLGFGATSLFTKSVSYDYWYDIYHFYVQFSSELTNIIDQLLTDPEYGEISCYNIVSSNESGNHPGYGKHYFYNCPCLTRFSSCRYIGLEKRTTRTNGETEDFYIGWIDPNDIGKSVLRNFKHRIFKAEKGTIRVSSVDTTEFRPKLFWNTQILHQPKPNQTDIVNFVMEQYTEKNNFNVKVLIHGHRGLGKTHTALLIKDRLDNDINCYSYLIDDFDPSQANVNIKSLILKRATATSPIVLIINEIESVYAEATKDKQFSEPRHLHTRNKKTLNDMFDAIGSTKYLIAIFTTEKAPHVLYNNEVFKSFLRPGRIDMFMHMEKDSSSKQMNSATLFDNI